MTVSLYEHNAKKTWAIFPGGGHSIYTGGGLRHGHESKGGGGS